MEKNNIMIRLEKKEEHQKVENLVRESFWNVYRPGCLEHYVLHQLRNDPAFVPELDQSNGKCSYETDKNLLDDYLKWFCEENAIRTRAFILCSGNNNQNQRYYGQ